MPKVKTKKSAAKRFRKTGSGKIIHNQAGNRHFGSRKTTKRKRRLRNSKVISGAMAKRTSSMLNS
mgnify:CR=1 FL=1|tara:strand:+ start:662 stop:856 length:195 start_codon:yes stop_codon:yes gene_type:complete